MNDSEFDAWLADEAFRAKKKLHRRIEDVAGLLFLPIYCSIALFEHKFRTSLDPEKLSVLFFSTGHVPTQNKTEKLIRLLHGVIDVDWSKDGRTIYIKTIPYCRFLRLDFMAETTGYLRHYMPISMMFEINESSETEFIIKIY